MSVELVSKCCGSHWVYSIDTELGIDAPEDYVCNSCQDFCDLQNDYDYNALMRDERAEMEADERRDLGI